MFMFAYHELSFNWIHNNDIMIQVPDDYFGIYPIPDVLIIYTYSIYVIVYNNK